MNTNDSTPTEPPTELSGARPNPLPRLRGPALDFTKGVLVLVMVAYHVLNYFWKIDGRIYMYLNYVTGGFIFISGFLCSTVYQPRLKLGRRQVHKRLLIRSAKLMLIFAVMNLAASFGSTSRMEALLDNIPIILLRGQHEITAFEILVPIAYVLALANILLYMRRFGYTLLVCLLAVLAALTQSSTHIALVPKEALIGVGGIFTGLVWRDVSGRFDNRVSRAGILVLALAYFLVAIPLGVTTNPLLYYAVVNMVVAALCCIGDWLNPNRCLARRIIQLGRYSLLLYLAQIVVLRCLRLTIAPTPHHVGAMHLALVGSVSLFLFVLAALLDWVRGRASFVDRTYRLIFG